MKKYKVWIHVEECDECNDHYEDIGLPECIGTFDLYEDAEDLFGIVLTEHSN